MEHEVEKLQFTEENTYMRARGGGTLLRSTGKPNALETGILTKCVPRVCDGY